MNDDHTRNNTVVIRFLLLLSLDAPFWMRRTHKRDEIRRPIDGDGAWVVKVGVLGESALEMQRKADGQAFCHGWLWNAVAAATKSDLDACGGKGTLPVV